MFYSKDIPLMIYFICLILYHFWQKQQRNAAQFYYVGLMPHLVDGVFNHEHIDKLNSEVLP